MPRSNSPILPFLVLNLRTFHPGLGSKDVSYFFFSKSSIVSHFIFVRDLFQINICMNWEVLVEVHFFV